MLSLVERKGRLRKEFPMREMQKRGWISRTDSIDELERSVFKFFDCPDTTNKAH